MSNWENSAEQFQPPVNCSARLGNNSPRGSRPPVRNPRPANELARRRAGPPPGFFSTEKIQINVRAEKLARGKRKAEGGGPKGRSKKAERQGQGAPSIHPAANFAFNIRGQVPHSRDRTESFAL
jgi:hypothetical protein